MINAEQTETIRKELAKNLGIKEEDINPELIQTNIDFGEKLSKGEITFAEAFNIPKEKLDVLYSVGYDFYMNGKYDKAINVFNVLCLYDPKNTDYWKGAAACYKRQKNFDRAVLSYYILAQLDKTQMASFLDLSECLMQLKKFEEAKACLGAVIALGSEPELLKKGNNNESFVKKAKALLSLLNKQEKTSANEETQPKEQTPNK